jgi:hypothetical protein
MLARRYWSQEQMTCPAALQRQARWSAKTEFFISKTGAQGRINAVQHFQTFAKYLMAERPSVCLPSFALVTDVLYRDSAV